MSASESSPLPSPRVTEHEVRGPWSLITSKRFWEGFTPSTLSTQDTADEIRTVFLNDTDWQRVETVVTQDGSTARVAVAGTGDLDAATAQVCRFLSLDIDARTWPDVGVRDPVIGDAQRRLPGLRPCGFYSPYEAAAWSVLSQRIQMRQAATIKAALTDRYGENGAFPAPAILRGLTLDLPGRKEEYLHAVADAALAGQLSGEHLRTLQPHEALRQVQEIKGLGPFAAELVVIRGANAPDVMPQNEQRLSQEITQQYGQSASTTQITDVWRPFRSWAAVHLRALREYRTHEIARGHRATQDQPTVN